MKHLFALTLLFGGFISFGQNFSMTTPIPVSTGNGLNHPQIEMSADGLPMVIWSGGGNNLFLAKHDGGSGFNPVVQLNPVGLEVQNYNWSGADLSVDGPNVYVVFHSLGYETGHVYVVKSTDNGVSFGDTVRVDNLATGFGQYPDIAVLQDTIWVTFMDHDAGGVNPQYVVARSVDGGLTYDTEVLAGALVGNEACDCCQPEIIVNDELVIVFFRNNNSNVRDIKAVVSTDRGQTFSSWFSVDDHNWVINACPSTGPDARFYDNNKFYCVYKTEVLSEPRVALNEYDFDGSVSTSMVNMTADTWTNENVNYPQLYYADDVLGVVWEGKGAGIDVFINSSSTGASGLDPANAINITNASGTQSKPDIAIGSGLFHVVYADYSQNTVMYVQLDRFSSVSQEEIVELDVIRINAETVQVVSPFSDGTLSVYGVDGQLLYKEQMNSNQASINTSGWNSGIYIVSIKLSDQVITAKLMIN